MTIAIYSLFFIANEKFDACCKVADLTGRDIRNICYDILTSWLNLGSQNAQSNVDMDMVCMY